MPDPQLTPDSFMRQQSGGGAKSGADLTPDAFMAQQAKDTEETKKKDRTPSASQRIQKFFMEHPVLRESILGPLGAAGGAETIDPRAGGVQFGHQFGEFFKGIGNLMNPLPQDEAEKQMAASQVPLPAYRFAKSLVQQTYGYSKEAIDAIDWKKSIDNAKNRKLFPYAFKEGKGPEFAHGVSGLATMIVMALEGKKKGPEVAESAAKTIDKARPTKIIQRAAESPSGVETIQRIAGTEATSPGMAEELTEKRVAERQAENVRAAEAHDKAVEKQQAAADKVRERNEQAQQAYQSKIDKINEAHDEKARAARKEAWSKATGESKREALEHAKSNTYPKDVKENVDRTYKRSRADYDSRWNSWRDKMGKDTGVPNQPRYDAIEKARGELAGVPQDLAIFNQIIKEITEKDAAIDSAATGRTELGEVPEGGLEPVVKPTTKLADYQRQTTALGEKAFGQTGNIGRVLRQVYETSAKELEKLAAEKGVGKEYIDLKKYTARFLEDWYGKNSPLSKIRQLSWVDRETRGKVAANALGIGGDMLRSMLGRYREFGANPDLVSEFRDVDKQLKALPKKKTPVVTEGPQLPGTEPAKKPTLESGIAEVEAARRKAIEAVKKPEPVALPPDVEAFVEKPLPTTEEIVKDLEEAKRKRARRAVAAESKPNRHDLTMIGVAAAGTFAGHHLFYATIYLPMRYGWTKFFRSELGMKVMTQITPNDISAIREVLDKVPGEKPEAQAAITQAIVDNVRGGGSVPPPKSLEGLLKPEQIGQIVSQIATEQKKGRAIRFTKERLSNVAATGAVAGPASKTAEQP